MPGRAVLPAAALLLLAGRALLAAGERTLILAAGRANASAEAAAASASTRGAVCCCKASTRGKCMERLQDHYPRRMFHYIPQLGSCCTKKDSCGMTFFTGYSESNPRLCEPPSRREAPRPRPPQPRPQPQPQPQPQPPPARRPGLLAKSCAQCTLEMCADDEQRDRYCRPVDEPGLCPICRADKRWAEEWGLQLTEVEADNNCLYGAIGKCVGKSHSTVRQEITRAMMDAGVRDLLFNDPRAWEVISAAIVGKGFVGREEDLQVAEVKAAAYARYVKEMIAKEGAWGTEDSIMVASLIYTETFQVVRCFYDTCFELDGDTFGDNGAVHKLVFFAHHWNVVV